VLTQMNVRLANVISDLSGLTGQTIVRAILTGERDPKKLAELSHPQIRASREEIARSLEGNWRPELLFVLKQEMEMFDTYHRRIAECDKELEGHLKSFADRVLSKFSEATSEQWPERKVRTWKKSDRPRKRKTTAGNRPEFDLRSELYRISGVDLTRIDSINVLVAQTVISEVGLDMSRWTTEAHFASWLGLCPDNRISGDKGVEQGNPTCGQSGGDGPACCRDNAAAESQLFGSTIPPLPNQTRSAQGDHRHGPETRQISVSDAEVRSGVRR